MRSFFFSHSMRSVTRDRTGAAVATMPGAQCTLAAACFYARRILPAAASYPDSWYVLSWTDTDGDSAPSADDTFTVLAHGL